MTRFKRELIKRGYQLEETLPYMPYNEIQAIVVDSEKATIKTYDRRVGLILCKIDRQFNSEEEEC